MCPQVEEKRKVAAMAALDKAERKLSMAREELAKAESVLQFASTQEALASSFRFGADNTVTHEKKDGEWLVCTLPDVAIMGRSAKTLHAVMVLWSPCCALRYGNSHPSAAR